MGNLEKTATLKIEGKIINIYGADNGYLPCIYFNTFDENVDEALLAALKTDDAPSMHIVIIGHIDWNNDMSPWYAPPIFKNDVPCTGGANQYLSLLTQRIIPETEIRFAKPPAWRGLAGYSLGGMFALYALYKTALFSRAACMSSSFWFPNFMEFVQSNKILNKPQFIYFSLGDKESKTKNPVLNTVLKNTDDIFNHIKNLGIHTTFQLNPGGHFDDAIKRCAAGINSIASYPKNLED